MWTEKLHAVAGRLLEENKVARVLGYAVTGDPAAPFPYLATRPEQVDRLVLNTFCAPNLAKYLLEYADLDGITGVVLKGCDAQGLERLLRDHRVAREKVHVLGLPCPGMLDRKKVSRVLPEAREAMLQDGAVLLQARREEVLLDKCLTCRTPTPEGCEDLLGEPIAPTGLEPDFATVAELEGQTADQRRAYWEQQFSRCLRCMACRQVCPACNCRSCSLESEEPRWLSRTTDASAQQMFHFIRAWHVAGRCVDCHECERVCPMDIPLMRLNRKLLQDVGELFQVPRAFMPAETEPLGLFTPEDREEFD